MQPRHDKSYTVLENVHTVILAIKREQSFNKRFPLPYKEVLETDKVGNC